MMRRTLAVVAILPFLVVSVPSLTRIATAQNIGTAVAAAAPSVGVVLAERPNGKVSGTAFVVADRLALTADHVVRGARRIQIKFPNQSAVEAKVVGGNEKADVATLSIPSLPIRPLPLGDSRRVFESQRIVVIGFPRADALGNPTPTVTAGVVTSVQPVLLHMDTPVNPGNAGAPVLNRGGEVVGIFRVVPGGEQESINFATEIDAAKLIVGPVAAALPPAPAGAPGSPGSPPGPDAYKIFPGHGIGPIKLGMDITTAIKLIGSPKSTHPNTADSTVDFYWYDPARAEGGYLLTARSGFITSVGIWLDSRYVTAGALHTRGGGGGGDSGVSQGRVEAVMGHPTRTETRRGPEGEILAHGLVYESHGVTFWVVDDARTIGNPPTSYLELTQNTLHPATISNLTLLHLHDEVVEIVVQKARGSV
ncbi:MAG TPA: serine protease [bacterium]|nr:serine protease [bacterium]